MSTTFQGKGIYRFFILCLVFCVPLSNAAEIYRWQDSNGTTHFSDTPPATAITPKTLRIDVPQGYQRVAKVTDGDTVVLEDGRRVRLLGIDTPEIAHRGQPGEALGEKARRFLKAKVAGKEVRLSFDAEHHDHYDRLLAHLFLRDGTNVNALMLEQGLAHALFKWPNMKLARDYYAREKIARKQGKGIWSLAAYRVRPMKKLYSLRNRFVRLRGKLDQFQRKRRYAYLIFGNKLKVAVRLSRLPLFKEAGIDLKRLVGQTITLRGWLRSRDGHPYLKLEHPFQLERFE